MEDKKQKNMTCLSNYEIFYVGEKMVEANINYLAVLAGAVVSMIIGFLWYGPLFGKTWMNLMGFKKEDIAKTKNMGLRYFVMFVGTLIMNYVLALFVDYSGATTILGGALAGFWLWLGFIATVTLGIVLWENKSFKLYLLNSGHYLVALVVMGIIHAVWI